MNKPKKNSFRCPTCRQDMREKPHPGLLGRDCPQCGQGIMWRFAAKKAQEEVEAK